MPIERKSYSVAEMKVADDQPGIIEAIVSVFSNVDHGNEKVMPGFFSKSIEKKLPKGVWAHDWKQPIAKTLEARELLPGDPQLPDSLKTLGGAYIKGQFNLDTQRGREAYSDIKFGIVDEFSIGYSVLKDQKDKESGARELIEGDWKEWSPVLVGMNDQTRLISIKEEPTEEKQDPPVDPPAGLTFEDHSQSVLAAVSELTHRAKEIAEIRKKEGRSISTARRTRLTELLTSLKTVAADIEGLLAETEPPPKEKGLDANALRIHSLRLQSHAASAIH